MGTFPQMLAIDGGGNAASNASGQLFATTDQAATTPLSPTDLFGLPFPGDSLVASSLGILPGFRMAGYTAVDWVSGGFRMTIPCIDQVPPGGASGQILRKKSGASYDVEWVDAPTGDGGGGGTVVTHFDDLLGIATATQLPAGTVMAVFKSGSTWPARPTNRLDIAVLWIGVDPSPPIVDSGTGGMLRNKDIRMVTA